MQQGHPAIIQPWSGWQPYPGTDIYFFYLGNGTRPQQTMQSASDKDRRKIKRRDTSQPLIIQQLRLTEECAYLSGGVGGFFNFLFDFLPCAPACLPASPAHSCSNECAQCCTLRYGDDSVILPPIVHGKMEKLVKISRRPVARG